MGSGYREAGRETARLLIQDQADGQIQLASNSGKNLGLLSIKLSIGELATVTECSKLGQLLS